MPYYSLIGKKLDCPYLIRQMCIRISDFISDKEQGLSISL